MNAQFQYGPARTTTSDETPESAERFACAVRLGRRKSDPFGRLVLSGATLQFRGGRDLDIPWRDVAAVIQVEHTVTISLHNTRRTLHFHCHSMDEAARGSAIARQLLADAHPQPSIAFG